jgi:hypothetical protein
MEDDEMGYRAALINAFRSRGIRPEKVISYNDESLSWEPYKGISPKNNPDFIRLWEKLNRYEDEPDRKNEEALYKKLWGKADTFRRELGLSLSPEMEPAAKSINALHRVRPDGSLQRQIVAELVQERQEEIEPGNKDAGKFTFRGGTTVLINRKGEVRYTIRKPIDGPEGKKRLEIQREYLQTMADSFALAPYVAFNAKKDLGFRGIHRGY